MKTYKFFYYVGTVLSLLIGIGHFFVPWLFEWNSYIPSEYENLIVIIQWVNSCFSFMLSGLSLLTIIWRKKIFSGDEQAITVFGFLTAVWLFRVVISIIIPLPLEPLAIVAYGQFWGAVLISSMLVIAFIKAIRIHKSKNR